MEFEQITFPASISSDDDVWREFLEIDNNSMFSKKWVLQKRKFLTLFFSYYVIITVLLDNVFTFKDLLNLEKTE